MVGYTLSSFKLWQKKLIKYLCKQKSTPFFLKQQVSKSRRNMKRYPTNPRINRWFPSSFRQTLKILVLKSNKIAHIKNFFKTFANSYGLLLPTWVSSHGRLRWEAIQKLLERNKTKQKTGKKVLECIRRSRRCFMFSSLGGLLGKL